MSRNPQAGMPALLAVCAVDLRQDVGGRNGAAQGAKRLLPNFSNLISAAGGTGRNFPRAVEFDVGRQVVRKVNAVTICQVVLQGELIGGGVNLAEVVNAGIRNRSRRATVEVGNQNANQKTQDD